MRSILCIWLVLLVSPGCDMRNREMALEQKEAALAEREQQVSAKENALQAKEEQLLLREQKLDSSLIDSIKINPSLAGQWAVKMTCTETTCTGSAVGDTKNETWHFSIENNLIIAKAMVGDKVVRTYSGTYVNNAIELTVDVEADAASPATKIIVRLNQVNPNSMEGLREIVRPDCKIVYTVQLNKP